MFILYITCRIANKNELAQSFFGKKTIFYLSSKINVNEKFNL